MTELSSRYNFRDIEGAWCQSWEDNKTFHGQATPSKKPYSIVIPPPNVTGILHMGHALNNTLQDIMIRYKRMNGFETCWMPGTDHAGIATQNVVERQLSKEGKTRHDIGRDEMLTRLWAWKKEYGDTIIKQLKKLGSSCDWDRTRFTMDEPYSEAVKEVFVRLYDKGLIYRGARIINWCPRCQTALSDEEAEHREQQGALYHIRYPFTDDPSKYLVVATTRPETMLGDTAVAVNPADPRYQAWIGKKITLPIVNREITIIADDFVDPAFGTGAVKVTPAHDPNDFAMGTRHKLAFINIMHPDGRLNSEAGEFDGMDRFEAREAVVENLKNLKLLEKVEPHTHAVGHCYRCHTVVEPYLSKQWFVKMKPLAQPALEAVRDGRIKFYPDRWTKVYTNWMEDIRDWCISRQIWWGHRLPVWYCMAEDGKTQKCPDPIVSKTTPIACPHCGSKSVVQDEDVLDTWFSSWLWPFATFGWPKENKDLSFFYPTASLFTASEIIFFWVARMIMAGIEFMGDIPFKDVYIHGTVRDAKGRKMSKSLGNAIDPLEIIAEYGADALRFSLIINSGQDLFISKEKFEIGRNFANKIWNASRLVLMNTPEDKRVLSLDGIDLAKIDLPTKWIISKFHSTLREVSRAIEQFRFSEAESLIYEFFWHCFCDWNLEITKAKSNDPVIQQVNFYILGQSLCLIHPFMPFVTEEIWKHLGANKTPMSQQPWPTLADRHINETAEDSMQTIIELVTAIRNIRVQWNLKPQQEIDCILSALDEKGKSLVDENEELLKYLLKLRELKVVTSLDRQANSANGIVRTVRYSVPLADVIDVTKERERITMQIAELLKNMTNLSQRLNNPGFLAKAPEDVVEKERIRLKDFETKINELQAVVDTLG